MITFITLWYLKTSEPIKGIFQIDPYFVFLIAVIADVAIVFIIGQVIIKLSN